jgi:ABC-type transport system involved in cytochrome bd biosynthesis fused ATPase/permease subunit
MKTIQMFKKVFAVVVVIIFSITVNQISAQSQKIDSAENKFCTNVADFIQSLENLEEANLGTDFKEFNKAYNKADKDWNKVVKSAEKLEEVEMSEGVKAYNDLVGEVNKIGNGTKSGDNTDKISKHISKNIETFNQIVEPICD